MYESHTEFRIAFECNGAHAILQLITIQNYNIRRGNQENRILPISLHDQNWTRKYH